MGSGLRHFSAGLPASWRTWMDLGLGYHLLKALVSSSVKWRWRDSPQDCKRDDWWKELSVVPDIQHVPSRWSVCVCMCGGGYITVCVGMGVCSHLINGSKVISTTLFLKVRISLCKNSVFQPAGSMPGGASGCLFVLRKKRGSREGHSAPPCGHSCCSLLFTAELEEGCWSTLTKTSASTILPATWLGHGLPRLVHFAEWRSQ